MTTVVIANEIYGDTLAVLRGINEAGCVVGMSFMPPIGTRVAIHFAQELQGSRVAMSAQAVVHEHEYTGRHETVRCVMFTFTGEWS